MYTDTNAELRRPLFQDPDDLTGIELAQIAGHDRICAFLQMELH